MTTLKGEHVPGRSDWVNDQIAAYESSGGTEGGTLLETGIAIIVVTMRGARSGAVRKIALMRVEHGGEYALVASKGGAPDNPHWYRNLVENPTEVTIQDGPEPFGVTVSLAEGEEYDTWWDRAVEVFAQYEKYRQATDRRIPIFVARRTD